MNYFAIEGSMNTKIVGKIPHTKEILHNCHVWDEPKFIDRMCFKKIEGIPILSNALLFPKAKLTDFIVTYGMGFTGSMLISDKLKYIFEKFNLFGLQFFSTFIIQNNAKIEGYWQTHISEQAYELLDFENINFTYKKRQDEKVIYEEINHIKSLEDFLKCKETSEWPIELYFYNLVLKKEANFDFFFIPHYINGNGYGIVSENLKNELEKNEIKGIEFRPIEISLQDWYHSEEREKTYGKI